uniref:SAM domain-containing protein n=1 Tax=Gasterosteus aculeatus aculeatus TaxID=481459 RepID=A0AAQ4PUJ5_GASAC
MSEPAEPSQEIAEWLSALRLSQYAAYFQRGGYGALKDCKHLTDNQLLGLKVFPTGHRRRVLRSLEALGVKEASGGGGGGEEEDERGEEASGTVRGRPVPHPRHIFLKDKRRGTSCQHQPKETRGREAEGSRTLPPGAGLGARSGDARPPQPAPRDPRNIQRAQPERPGVPAAAASFSTSSTSSCESLAISESASDREISSEGPSPRSAHSFPEDRFLFQGDMVDNSIYAATPMAPAGPRITHSYRLRHRPVPEIPDLPAPPLPERSRRTSGPEHLAAAAAEGPTGGDGTREAPLQRAPTVIAPYGELFLYNNPESTQGRGATDRRQRGFKDKMKQRKLRKKMPERKQSKEKFLPPAPKPADSDTDEYSTVKPACETGASGQGPEGPAVGPAAPDAGSLVMVECDLYSEAADAPGGGTGAALPDISPYACFYGAPKHQVLKVGWLDKLSPQGNCVFQRRWVRLDGDSLAYYNNDKSPVIAPPSPP